MAAERHLTTMSVRPCYSDLGIHIVDSLLRGHVRALNLHEVKNEADVSSHFVKFENTAKPLLRLAQKLARKLGS